MCWSCKELTDARFKIIPKIVRFVTCRTWNPPLDHPCQVCQRTNEVNQMLLCDNCNGGYHLFWFKPKLTQILVSIKNCSSCFPIAPWFLFRPCHAFLGLGMGGDTWKFHLNLLLCIVYICACISFWLINFYLWLVLVFCLIEFTMGLHPYDIECHNTTRQDSCHACMHDLIYDDQLRAYQSCL